MFIQVTHTGGTKMVLNSDQITRIFETEKEVGKRTVIWTTEPNSPSAIIVTETPEQIVTMAQGFPPRTVNDIN